MSFLFTVGLIFSSRYRFTSTLLTETELDQIFPNVNRLSSVTGILSGLLYTLFFSICPFIFKALANFGSGATSVRQAEFKAIRYYWLFILVTAFTGSSLATMVTQGLYSGTSKVDQWYMNCSVRYT